MDYARRRTDAPSFKQLDAFGTRSGGTEITRDRPLVHVTRIASSLLYELAFSPRIPPRLRRRQGGKGDDHGCTRVIGFSVTKKAQGSSQIKFDATTATVAHPS